jgi:nitrite reductase (NADH) large subunit
MTADWHRACKLRNNPTSVNDDRQAVQVMGTSGRTGEDVRIDPASEQAKAPGTARFQAFFFAFFKP